MRCLLLFRRRPQPTHGCHLLLPPRPFSSSSSSSSLRGSGLNFDELPGVKCESFPPLVLAHGMLGSAANWGAVAKHVNQRTGRRVVSYDARNHGRSRHAAPMTYEVMAEDLQALLRDDLRVDRAVLLGHSMGGRTAMLAALLRPETVDKLFVVDVSPVNYDRKEGDYKLMSTLFEALLHVNFPSDPSLPLSSAKRDMDNQLKDLGGTLLQDPMLRAWLLMNLDQDSSGNLKWRINVQNIYDAYKHDLAKFPDVGERRYEGETVFIGGEKSPYIPASQHGQIRRLFPAARFEVIPGAGHWVHSEKPKEFLAVLDKYLD